MSSDASHKHPSTGVGIQREAASIFAGRELQALGAILLLYLFSLEQIKHGWREADIQKLRGDIEQRFPEASEFPIWEKLYRLRSRAPAADDVKSVDDSLDKVLDVFRQVQEGKKIPSDKRARKSITESVGDVDGFLKRYIELKKVAKAS